MNDASVAVENKRWAYIGLTFVILVWGSHPLITLQFYQYYSPTIRIAFTSLISGLLLLFIARKKLHLLNRQYFKIAVSTGFFMSIANIVQKIGLQYTTPTHYAFLENLSCIIVPVLLILFIKKKPGFLTICSALLCLFSSFILTGMSADSGNVHWVGDLLCALSGIFYGVNIAGTGAFAKNMYAPLYLAIQMFTEVIVSFVGAMILSITNIEPILFCFDWRLILANVALAFFSSTLCWLIRTNAIKHVDASVVAVISPFSSVITMVLSVLTGNDMLSVNLVAGAALGLIAIILSGLGDRLKEKAPSQ